MRRVAALAFVSLLLAACSTPRAYVRMRNVGTQPVREVEMNYGVMFGVGELKPGEMKERHVPIANGADLSLRFYDSANRLHQSQGPHIEAHVSGQIEARIGDNGQVQWQLTLKD